VKAADASGRLLLLGKRQELLALGSGWPPEDAAASGYFLSGCEGLSA
jgi:hypothetical protein